MSTSQALNYGKFSTASDVWSFGALLYEIWSLGRKPFEEKDNQEVIKLIQTGYRLPPPPGCPRSVYATMISCWHSSAHLRPEFSDIHANLKQPLSSIFSWSEENKEMAGNPQATVLGAPISAGFGLYEDLQQTYTKREQ
jgi:serine/threonine protein kinase